MAAGKLFTKALSFLSRPYYPLPHLRRLSTTATAGDLNPFSPRNDSVSVLDFLRGRGLGDELLAPFAPRLLDSKVGKDLPAKFDLLLTLGFSVPEAAKVLRYNSLLRHTSLISLQQRLDTIRTIASDADLPLIVTRTVWILYSSQNIQRMVDNVSKLRGWGVSDAKIRYFLVTHPGIFQVKPQSLEETADRAETEFGFRRRDSKTFMDAVIILRRTSESTLQSKFRVFESFGWESSGIKTLFKTNPTCLNLAEATLVKKLGFLVNEAGYDPSYITNHAVMLGFNLEKRVRPRFELVNALKSKNLLPKSLAFYSTFCINESEFMEKYVIKFMKEEPAICNAYINTVAPLNCRLLVLSINHSKIYASYAQEDVSQFLNV